MSALPAIHRAAIGLVAGLIFGVIVAPRTVNRDRPREARRAAVAGGIGAVAGLAVFDASIELGII